MKWAFIILLALYFFCWPVKVSGVSMEPSLSDGDRVLMSRFMAVLETPDRGDIVIINMKMDGRNKDIVKRVIGVAGDRVEIKDGLVFLNGLALEETYAKGQTEGLGDTTVPYGFVYVLGDNRCKSTDSRSFGLVSSSRVVGKVFLSVCPPAKIE